MSFPNLKNSLKFSSNNPLLPFTFDSEGEYQTLKQFFQNHSITHLQTLPYTPQYNGFTEWHLRHLIEKTLTLLHQAPLPVSFWTYALKTTIYLINQLPTPLFNFQSPYAKLFQTVPNYLHLKIFRCLCYPWLRPYNKIKLEPHSKPCAFLGYTLHQSAYICFDTISHKLFTSCHMTFQEDIFSLSNMYVFPI